MEYINTIKYYHKAYNFCNLSLFIDKYLVPHINEKKQNAEVSTPASLRKEMLDKIPIEFWKTPKKVIMSESRYLKPFYDNGILGIGGHCFSCIVNNKDDGEYIIKLLNSKLYKFYIEINKWSGFHHKKVLQDLPFIKLKEYNEEEIYKLLSITKEEKEFIENII